MQPKHKKAICVVASICLLAILAVAMVIGTGARWFQENVEEGIRLGNISLLIYHKRTKEST